MAARAGLRSLAGGRTRQVGAPPRGTTWAADPILVVDDDPECCRLMAATLELHGHRVEWTTDPARAVQLVQAQPYALVVSDVNMPTMLGTSLVAELGRLRPGLPTILVTAFADRRVRAEAEALGSTLLTKPLRVDALAAAVRGIVSQLPEKQAAR